ncbi:uncharacterized protein LTHEOB_1656 [Lasiodiplodia theobromae]|uniref:uncharacterized protein n=1 Tax=Lasiodiplodia theobromae TaxID=45133 RepID=UPI0015C3497F|nr:uncharacterized protein LTHEOB_1656 [Lasiodiplodia theobromae]KAF4537465.1 hypothetical protein LTHEOB_1656 [Lasiodiplodia theobromae]
MKNMSAARGLLVAAFAATPVLSAAIKIPQSPGHFTSIHQREVVEKCPGFNGNPDLYGLGIRLGVYSQWFSSWLTNTCNPSAAAANHDANSIFLLALLIGISVAVANDAIRPVEAYVMLHICFGFIFTVLSLLGVRVYFLTPRTLSEFLCHVRIKREALRGSVRGRIQAVQTAFRHFQEWLRSRGEDDGEKEPQQQEEGHQDNRRASVASMAAIGRNTICGKLVRNLRQMPDASLPASTLGLVRASTIEFTSDAVSFLKHPSLSWSGVAWRSAVLTYLIGLNLWFWWSPWLIDKVSESTGGKACAPSIFFFGHQHITGSLLDFFRSVSVILAIPALWLCWIILSAAFAVWKFVLGFLARWLVITALERISPGMWDNLYDGTKFAIGLCLTPFMLWDNIWPYVVIDGFLGSPVLLHGIYSFWTIESGDLPGWSDLWKPFISFMSRGTDLDSGAARTPGGRLEEKQQASIP